MKLSGRPGGFGSSTPSRLNWSPLLAEVPQETRRRLILRTLALAETLALEIEVGIESLMMKHLGTETVLEWADRIGFENINSALEADGFEAPA